MKNIIRVPSQLVFERTSKFTVLDFARTLIVFYSSSLSRRMRLSRACREDKFAGESRTFQLYISIVITVLLFSGFARAENELEQKLGTFSLSGYADRGTKKWEISAKTADIREGIVKLDNITARAFADQGSVTLTADEGFFDRKTQNIRLEKNVVAVTNDGARLSTDCLNWQAEQGTVTTDSRIVVEKENIKASGKGALALPHLGKVELREDVELLVLIPAKAFPQGGKETVITCDGPLELDYKNNTAVFKNNVRVKDSRGVISADTISVWFHPRSESVTQVVAENNVEIIRGEDRVCGNKAVYTREQERIILTGRPRVVFYGSE